MPAPDLHLVVPARAEYVGRVRHAVQDLVLHTGLDADRRADVILAVGEACANAVMHAYAHEDEPGELEVSAGPRDGLLEVVVADRGHGMAPRPDSPGLGLGLPLMATLSHTLEVRPAFGGGTEVWMTFALAG